MKSNNSNNIKIKSKKILTISSALCVSLPLLTTFSCGNNSDNLINSTEAVNKFVETLNISLVPGKEAEIKNILPSQIKEQPLTNWFTNIPSSNNEVDVKVELIANNLIGSFTINVKVSSKNNPNVFKNKEFTFNGFKSESTPEDIVSNFIHNMNVSLIKAKETDKPNTLPSHITVDTLSNWFNLPASNNDVTVKFDLTPDDQAGSLKIGVTVTSTTKPSVSEHVDFSFNGFKKVAPTADDQKLVNDYINNEMSKITIKEDQKANQANTLASTITKDNLNTWFNIPMGSDKVTVTVVEVFSNDSTGTLKITFKVSSGSYNEIYSFTQSGFKTSSTPVIDYQKEVNDFVAQINISLKPEKHDVLPTTLASTIQQNDLNNWFNGIPVTSGNINVSLSSIIPNNELGKLTLKYSISYETASKDYTFIQTGFKQEEASHSSDYSYRPKLTKEIPSINVTLDSGLAVNQLSKTYTGMTISITDPNNEYPALENLTGQIKVRGNSTSEFIKKPYRIKLTNKSSMLGLNNNNQFKDWVLLAEWRDPSFLRNGLGLYLGQLLYKPKGLYASDFRLVELNINNEYQGLYVLCEQNEVNPHRVDINKPAINSTDVNIGYLIEMDGSYADQENPNDVLYLNYNNKAQLLDENGENIFRLTGIDHPSEQYVVKSKTYPNASTPPSPIQKNFIGNYLENIYRICYKAIIENQYYEFNADKTNIVQSSRFSDKFSTIKNVVDVDSVVAMIILQEIACNYDVNNSSFYLSIDLSPTGNGKLKFQAPWDFDVSFGTEQARWLNTTQPNGLFAVNARNPWITLMYKSDEIKAKIKSKWKEMIDNKVPELLISYLDESSKLYVNQYKNNFDKWKNIGNYINTRYEELKTSGNPELYSWGILKFSNCPESALKVENQEGAKNYLRSWLITRLTNLNSIWSK